MSRRSTPMGEWRRSIIISLALGRWLCARTRRSYAAHTQWPCRARRHVRPHRTVVIDVNRQDIAKGNELTDSFLCLNDAETSRASKRLLFCGLASYESLS